MNCKITLTAVIKEGPVMRASANKKGFTLIELMMVIAIVAILVALAVPSYTGYVRKAKRVEAQQILMNWANLQEIWRGNHSSYASDSDITEPSHDDYDFYVRRTGTSCESQDPSSSEYVLVACPKGDQASDIDRNTPCNPLSLNQAGAKGPKASGVTVCWGN
jgi:type IV pilus assembly protein PilE